MKTIVHIILGKANPNRMNGVNKVVYQLANAQSGIGEKVEVWGITKNPNSSSDYSREFHLRLFKKHRNSFEIDTRLLKAIEAEEQTSIFHLHGGFIPEMYVLGQILSRNNRAYVFTPHGSYNILALRKSYFLKKIYLNFFEKTLLKKAEYVHLIGQSEIDSMDALHLEAKRVLIPNGQILEQETVIEDLFDSPEVSFGFMGRFTVYTKGLDLLLKGFQLYKNKYRGSGKLKLIGAGGEEKKIKKLVSDLNLSDSVIFMGAKYGDEKKSCLQDLTGFFHPSRNEGMPGAVLEASALGVPCVVSKATNLMDYVVDYHAGFGLKNNSPEYIANAMVKLELRKKSGSIAVMVYNAQRMIAEEFDWKIIAKRFSSEVFV
ncbi:glycosyltransferase family 4 protein [Ancylomarina sp. DW003]|nr:glycosyltransferase family 4 protein [Ancylomarina sp. DW003]MDE5424097.1 glycosyltransferase family 4 protein [Ancylomarina sp. DW003]